MDDPARRIIETLSDPRDAWEHLSQLERDDAYDNLKAVAGSAELVAKRDADSAAYRARHATHVDVPYADGERTRFDFYVGPDSGAPCLVFLHGGYWQRNSREGFALLAEGVTAHGWSVAMPGYTLAPAATLTRIVDEVTLALDWLAVNGPSVGIAGPVILSGWSAGAQLAALALGHPRVAAGLAVSGVYDLGPIRDTKLDAALRLTDAEIAALSPLRLTPVMKPLTIAYGAREVAALVHDAARLHRQRDAAGAPGTLLAVDGADHFSILEELQRPDGMLVKAAMALADAPAG